MDVKEKVRIFQFLAAVLPTNQTDDGWRDGALQLIVKVDDLNSFYPLFAFLIRQCCNSEEEAVRIFEHLRIHMNSRHLTMSKVTTRDVKRVKTGSIPTPNHLMDCLRVLMGNKFAMDTCKKWLSTGGDSVVALVFALLLLRIPSEQKTVLSVFKGSIAADNLLQATDLFIAADPANTFITAELARKCGTGRVAEILMLQSVRLAESFIARELILSLTSLMTEPKSADWALATIQTLCEASPGLLMRHSSALKVVVLDHLDRLTLANIRLYYICLLRLALWAARQGDASLWSELQVLLRKQITSLDSQVRWYGAAALLALAHVLGTDDIGVDSEEATCSQAPRQNYNQKYVESLMVLFDAALNLGHSNLGSFIFLCEQFQVEKLDLTIVRHFNKRLSLLFEEKAIVELRSSKCTLEHNLDGDEVLIGISLTPSTITLAIPHLFKLLAITEKRINNGNLDSVDALLGCPLLIEDEDGSDLIVGNWLRVLLNSFSDQDDREVQDKCCARLNLLADLVEKRIPRTDGNYKTSLKESVRMTGSPELVDFVSGSKICGINGVTSRSRKRMQTRDQTNVLIPLEPIVFVKYLSSAQGMSFAFLLSELPRSKLSGWDDQQLSSVLNSLLSKLPTNKSSDSDELQSLNLTVENCNYDDHQFKVLSTIVLLCAEINQRDNSDLSSIMESINSKIDASKLSGLCLVKLLELPLLRGEVGGWASSCEAAIEYVFEDGSAVEASTILERILTLHKGDIELIELLLNRFAEVTVGGKGRAIAIYGELFKALAIVTPLDTLTAAQRAGSVFEQLVSFGRQNVEDEEYVELLLKFARLFLERFTRNGIALFSSNFISYRTAIIESLRTLQGATRALQIVCNHVKGHRAPRMTLPPLRRALEKLLFAVKGLLQDNHCLRAFWVGNLKHRAIDGAEASSQVQILGDSTEEEEDDIDKTVEQVGKLSKDILTTDTEGENDKDESVERVVKLSKDILTTDAKEDGDDTDGNVERVGKLSKDVVTTDTEDEDD